MTLTSSRRSFSVLVVLLLFCLRSFNSLSTLFFSVSHSRNLRSTSSAFFSKLSRDACNCYWMEKKMFRVLEEPNKNLKKRIRMEMLDKIENLLQQQAFHVTLIIIMEYSKNFCFQKNKASI